jgi:L,D-peptidoglycan transpeptidase YkuD (ErfK/YbiS/YcfS/YnhG family)
MGSANERRPAILRVKPFRVIVCLVAASAVAAGCGHLSDGAQARKVFAEANDLFHQGNLAASLDRYSEIIDRYPAAADRALFEMGVLYAHPKNERKDYLKALECFEKLIREYPESPYRQNGEMMTFNIRNAVLKDKTIAGQQALIDALRSEVRGREVEIAAQRKKIEALEKKFVDYALQKGTADRILIEKGARRLTLISQGEALKSYRIALGGNPVGPKERQGDNKTPEGIYVIEGRNRDSKYHLSLRISYPNEKDRARAKELGVSPGGDIMIHGIKNDMSWVGEAHAGIDWTKGCIAVTDEEIEEIARAAPNGTVVEIRP